jgi:alkylated DNA repair dioxygenase AlkB
MKRENRVFFSSEYQALETGYRPCGTCMRKEYKAWKMDLFNQKEELNLLPADGTVHYYGRILNPEKANTYLETLLGNIEWKNDEAVIFGRHIITKRKAAWYGNNSYSYTYSNTTKFALPWTKELLELKELVEEKTVTQFNSCLLNLYHNGDEGMAWHSDDERSLGKDSTIASLSLGAERVFSLKHKITKENVSVRLENGSLLVMKDKTQSNWLHSLPKTKKVTLPRVNLTFRTMIEQ